MMSIENRVESVLSNNIFNVKECSCDISETFINVLVVSNVFGSKGKLIGRHKYVKEVLNKAGLSKELSSYSIQIVALTRKEYSRREKIGAELQPGYKPPARKTKSSKGGSSKKKRSASTPLVTKSNVKSRTKADDDFIVEDDDVSDCSWNSSDEESMADEQDDDSDSDDEFEMMLLESESDEDDL